jgi:hypothetical protein
VRVLPRKGQGARASSGAKRMARASHTPSVEVGTATVAACENQGTPRHGFRSSGENFFLRGFVKIRVLAEEGSVTVADSGPEQRSREPKRPGRPTRAGKDPRVSPPVRLLVARLDELIADVHGSRTRLLAYVRACDPSSPLGRLSDQQLSKQLRGLDPYPRGPD